VIADTGTCRSCGATIVWAITAKGRRMPLDPDPIPGGNVTLHEDGAVTVNPATDPETEVLGYVTHFVTCYAAKQHRGKRGT